MLYKFISFFSICFLLQSCITEEGYVNNSENRINYSWLDSLNSLPDSSAYQIIKTTQTYKELNCIDSSIIDFGRGLNFYEMKLWDSSYLCFEKIENSYCILSQNDTLKLASKLHLARIDFFIKQEYQKAEYKLDEILNEVKGKEKYRSLYANALYYKTSLFRNIKMYDEAHATYNILKNELEKSITLDSQLYVKSKIVHANLFLDQLDIDNSSRIYDELINLCKSSKSLNHRLSYLYYVNALANFKAGRYESALKNAKKLLNIDPENRSYQFMRYNLDMLVAVGKKDYNSCLDIALKIKKSDLLNFANDYEVLNFWVLVFQSIVESNGNSVWEQIVKDNYIFGQYSEEIISEKQLYISIEELIYKCFRTWNNEENQLSKLRESFIKIDSTMFILSNNIAIQDRYIYFDNKNRFYDYWIRLEQKLNQNSNFIPFIMDRRKFLKNETQTFSKNLVDSKLSKLKEYAIEKNTAIISYYLSHEIFLANVITKDGVFIENLKVDDLLLHELISDLEHEFNNPTDSLCFEATIKKISTMLWTEKMDAIKANSIVIIADHILNQVPFYLINNRREQNLISNYDLATSYSLEKLIDHIDRPQKGNKKIRNVASVLFSNHKTLRNSTHQLLEIPNNLLESKLFFDLELRGLINYHENSGLMCSKKNFINSLKNFEIIHVGTHAKGEKSIEDSYVLLRKNINDLDSLRYEDLLRNRVFFAKTELLYFSSCESLLGTMAHSGGFNSLGSYLGLFDVSNIIASYYSVIDENALELSSKFYVYYLELEQPLMHSLNQAIRDNLFNKAYKSRLNSFKFQLILN